MKTLFEGKETGYKQLLLTMLLSFITLVVYVTIYKSTKYISWEAVRILVFGLVLTAVLIYLKLERFAPTIMLLADFSALLFHIYYIYFFISSVVTGIQFSGFPISFFVNFVFFGITLLSSIICVFMPIEKG